MQQKFAKLFDDAPQIPYSEVLSVFKSEFGRSPSGPNGVFQIFDENAIASASIAQVHKAKLWPSPHDPEGQWVAVKIQKPAVAKQTEWDLGAYRMVLWMFEKWAFDLPVYFVVGGYFIICIFAYSTNFRFRFGPSSTRARFH